MDINPWKFQSPFEACELATFANRAKVDLVICSMAWLDSDPGPTKPLESQRGTETEEWNCVRRLVGYWAARMEPLLGSGTVFLACNRVGNEGGELILSLAGSSRDVTDC